MAPFFQAWENSEGRCDAEVDILELGASNFDGFLDRLAYEFFHVVDAEKARQKREKFKADLRSLLELDKNESVKSGVANKKMAGDSSETFAEPKQPSEIGERTRVRLKRRAMLRSSRTLKLCEPADMVLMRSCGWYGSS